MTLRPVLQRLLNSVNQVSEEFERRVVPMSELDLLARPGENQWTIAEIIEHLNLVHSVTVPRFFSALEVAPAVGGERSLEMKYRVKDKIFIRAMSPGFPLKLPVPPVFEPTVTGAPKGIVLPKFRGLQAELVRVIKESDAKQLAKLTILTPANERIHFSYMAYLEGTVMHEQYHWSQIVKRIG